MMLHLSPIIIWGIAEIRTEIEYLIISTFQCSYLKWLSDEFIKVIIIHWRELEYKAGGEPTKVVANVITFEM